MSRRAKVCLVGASGRMGTRCVRLLAEHERLRLGAVLLRRPSEAPPAGLDIRHATDIEALLPYSDVVIDFSAPPACAGLLPACARANKAYVLASTGLSQADEQAVTAAQGKLPLLHSANLSLGVTVMRDLVGRAAAALAQFDVEVSEMHHRHKKDAPSGTARMLAQAVQAVRPQARLVLGRAGEEPPRDAAQLGIASVRGGEVAGEHTVYLFGDAERLEITHRSSNADIFAIGALRAAVWLMGRPPGLYRMQDVLHVD